MSVVHSEWVPDDDNIDIVVTLEDGSRYSATCFTLANVQKLMRLYQDRGDCLAGTYFWSVDMIIVKSLHLSMLQDVVKDIIAEGMLDKAMTRVDPGPS